MKKTILTLATLSGFSLAGGAMAQTLEFSDLDIDANGILTYEELLLAIPDLTPEAFGAIDADGDGVISPEEFTALTPEAEFEPAPAPEPLL